MRPRKRWLEQIRWLVFCDILAVALAAPARATVQQAVAGPPAELSLLPVGGATWDHHLERLRRDFSQLDANHDGELTQGDVDIHAEMRGSLMRSYSLQHVMPFDLDADGMATEGEIRRGAEYYFRSSPIPQQVVEEKIKSIMALDTDKDGKISVLEAGKLTLPEMTLNIGSSEVERTRRALTLEVASSGAVTLQQYEAAGEALFRKIDIDSDGKISHQELDAYRRARLP
jgi:Ca2+-binding EF-hand superfamily protein